MSAIELLSQLGEHGVQLWVEQDRLRVRAPKGVLTPILRSKLDQHKQDLIDLLSRARIAPDAAPPMALAGREGNLPLSFAQERLWFLDQLDPGSRQYNVPAALRLSGRLDRGALARSFTEIVRRHEALRTRFAAAGGQPVQVIEPAWAVPVATVDLESLPAAEREAEGLELLRAEAARPFDLSSGRLLRLLALRHSESEHWLMVTMHHIVSDGWSVGVLIRELVSLYRGFVSGEPVTLPELPVQYADFAIWQRSWLAGEALERELAYWREQLAGVEVLDLPTDRPRPAVPSGRGSALWLELPMPLSASLRSLSRERGTTLFMTLLAGFQSLLSRSSGQTDIAVGSPIAGRTRGETEGLIGFFVNMLVLRARGLDEGSFADLLERMREVTLGAYAHQEVPFEKLVEEVQPARRRSHAPLFQVVLALQNAPRPEIDLPDLSLGLLEIDIDIAKFDLTLSLEESDGSLQGFLEYSTDLFDRPTMLRFGHHLEVLLDAAVQSPTAPVASLPLLTPWERQQVVREWPGPLEPYRRDALVPDLVRGWAERGPDRVAVVCGEASLSYGELDRRSGRLAAHLRSLGVAAETRVGLCLERGLDMVAGFLGILRSGGAYVPLDPSHPRDRLEFVVADAGVEVVLTQQELEDRLPEGLCRVRVEDDPGPVEPLDPVEIFPESLAYVIYTSGSTGRPKGVSISHEAVTWLVYNMGYIHSDERDVVAQTSNTSFDAATFEIWRTLCQGSRLAILPREVVLSPRRLESELCSQGVTVLYLTTALLNQVSAELPGAFAGLRHVLSGGEAVDPERMRQVVENGKPERLTHMYGPTETTVFSTWHLVEQVPAGTSTLPIGQPMTNTVSYVLDRELKPVPIGVSGELLTGGDCLARGYLNRPDLTAERFIPDPFSLASGARLYRTGDLMRWVAQGELEFVSRLDDQVKIRGFRVEPGEIEAVLAQHPSVAKGLVLVRKATDGERRLVAYVVPSEGSDLEVPQLRDFLRQRLPDYMVPSAFVLLSTLPLTPNGKVDRKALPEPEGARAGLGREYVAPRTPAEELLASIWCDLLRVEKVGIHDDFFELGGHSLLATQVASRVREALGVELPLQLLFDAPTLAGLADGLGLLNAAAALQLVPAARSRALPLSFAQERLWFLDQLEPGSVQYNLPAALRLRGRLDHGALARSFTGIVRRHEVLRTRFAVAGGQPVQVIEPAWEVPLVTVDLESLPAAEREAKGLELLREEAAQPFDLSSGRLLRLLVLRLSESEHWLVVTMHHIVSDGWSVGVLIRELASLYRGIPLPELPLQYAGFAVWQRSWLAGEVLERELAYWREQLAGIEVLDLPTDRPRPSVPSGRGAALQVELPASLSASLRSLSRERGATLFMTLLAGFHALLSLSSGQADIPVGSPIAGRTRKETEGLVGFFVNMLVLRARGVDEGSFADLLEQVREVTLGAYAHQEVPFEKLVEELQPARRRSHAPLFQVVLALQNAPRPDLELPDLSLGPLEVEIVTAKFDLTLSLEESGRRLQGFLEYSTDLFDRPTMLRFGHQLAVLLAAAVQSPAAPVASLPLLTPWERQQVVQEWPGPLEAYPKDALVPDLVRRWAERGPERVAVVCGEASLSRGELDRRSDRLAARLRSLGVAAETRVGVCLERGLDTVVGFLAILKSGGAYVPLDPSHPRERLEFVVADAGVEVVLTQQELMDRLPEDLCRVRVEDNPRPGEPLASVEIFPESLAYVIYTSGSTGRPKGVSISHEAVTWLVFNMGYIHSDERDVVGQTSNTSFDAATFEIWRTLCQGSRLVILPREVVLSPRLLALELRSQGVTVLYLTTALFNQVSAELPDAFRDLRHVLSGGEAVDPQRMRQVVESGKPERLTHMYGPTETTVFSTWHLVEQVPAGASTLPIGRPMTNTVSYVLDRELKPLPIGVSGELLTGGDCLARGYLNRPDLTAERFIPDPFSREPGARLYRTGDLMRWVAQGELEFVSRLDDQVKIRGFRVEPGEIEAVLAQHPSVAKGLVMVRKAADGERRLVAYVVPAEGSDLDIGQLRDFLRRRLPDYMVPSAFVLLSAMPLTPNGKVDRKALPEPEGARAGLDRGYVAPRTPAEELLASIWCDLLGVEKVGIHDDFFELGGHSLLATQVASRVREALGAELPLQLLFEAPTIAGLADGLGLLNAAAALQLVPAARSRALPLSFAQERLWFLDQLDPGSVQYNVPAALRLRGRLDHGALARSFTEIVRRHEALRTRFAIAGGQPVQVIEPAWEVPLVTVDLESLPEAEREAKGLELLREEAAQPFDLSSGRLLRLLALRLSESEHWLVVTMHHIVSDGWSVGVLIRELASLYRGIPLPELPLQYADFSVWQRSWLTGEVLERELAYWREQLAGVEVLDLPTDRPRPAVPSGRGAALPVGLPASLSASLRSLGRERGTTLFMTLLAGFQSLLSLCTGQADIPVGSPIAGRTRRETEGLVGFFVNMLVLRARGVDEGSFADLLEQVRGVTLGAFAHQDLPFEKLVEELQPARRRSHAPLFQVVLALQNAPRPDLDLPDLSLGLLEIEVRTAKFDLTLSLEESGGRLQGFLEYSTDLFDRSTMLRLGHQLEVLLAAAVQSPRAPVASLPLLTPWELQQVVQEWPGPLEPYPKDALVTDLVRRWAERGPERVAVVCGEASLSYGELDRRSGRLAAHLRSLGVAAETRVGLCLERGLDMVVGFLAILKSGGAYVPLDPSHPRDRLEFVVADAGVEVVLTQRELMDRLPDGLWVVRVEEDHGPGEPLAPAEIFPGSLAYVIYTSGSTGRPKGVSISHEAVTWLVFNMGYIHSDERDVVGQTSNTSFDAATFEIWRTLCQGSRLAILPREVVLSPRRLEAELHRQGVTVLYLTTALFNQVSAELPGAFAGLRHVLSGGEAVDPERMRQVVESGKPERLTHMYGPTETTVFSTWHLVEQVPVGASTLPIGQPMTNTVSYVLDRELKPVPIGVSGELLTGGDCLARGYLNRPDLTAERFIPDPFSREPGARLYRTGDVMRWVAQGELEFVSRLDDQVKIRGFRVEPGEIEAVLAQHPSVVKGLVIVRKTADGERRLVAYVVPSESSDLDVPQLREFLRRRLPDYMVPSAFVLLSALPLTPNGKVDRKALPEPEGVRAGLGGEYVAPRTPAEELLASIWCDLLGLEQIGIHDDFFELGGHSLLATQVASRVREAFGVELPLQLLFEAPTIAGLADGLSLLSAAAAPPILPVAREGDLPLSFAQERLWFLDQLEPGNSTYNIPLAVRLTGELRVELLERVFAEVVRRHEALRTTFASHEGRPVQVIAPPGAARPELLVTDLSGLPEAEREARALHVATEEAGRPFDLQSGPLLRLGLVRITERNHLLLVTMHHIISDGWSLGVLLREITVLYEAFMEERPSPLPELPLQYADHSHWQRSWLQGPVLEEQLAYWKEKLAGAPPFLELPVDHPRPPIQTYRGASVPAVLSPALSTAVRGLCRSRGMTPFMVLLAGWSAVLGRLAGQSDVLVGSPIAGRNRREVEGLIGLFVNTLVLRTDLSASPGFGELLERVRRTALAAFDHQDLPFERLVEELLQDRDLAHSPLFQVLFVLQNAPLPEVRLPALTLAPVHVENRVAKLDLTLTFGEGAEGFSGELEHNTDLFDRITAERLVDRLQALLEAAAADPEQAVMDLPLLLPAERQQLREWSDGGTPAAVSRPGLCLHELFTAQAVRTPEAVALIHGATGRLTYAELAARVEGLAGRLHALGTGPEARVAVCLERSADLIVSLLAVLAAGGAYVPIDPAYPAERRALMLEDSGATVVVTRGRLAADLPAPAGVRMLDLDAAPRASRPGEEGRRALPGNLAYVIYTSGSTGRPKGVAIEHRSAVALALWARDAFSAEELSGVLAATSVCFDLSVFEIFVPLAWGGTVLLAENALELPVLPAASEVRLLNTVPAAAAELVRSGLPASVRTVNLAGEPLPGALAARLYATGTVDRVLNLYGPSEDTTYSTGALVPRTGERAPAIGRPLPGARAWVVDPAGTPVPPGVVGELWLAGVGLARGYLGRPELTAERFTPDPFGGAGERVYRTGDRVRHRPDGELEFLGRVDFQVKVRGFRIELQEIEETLLRSPAVRECVVLARDGRLLAWVALHPGEGLGDPESALRSWLAGKLPAHMVPSAFVLLESLPRTPNGKVDRRALPLPDRVRSSGEQVAPRTPTEELLTAIWGGVLELDRIGVHDDFFALGGHSLLATQLVSRVRETFQVELPLRALFEAPHVAGLARKIEELRGSRGDLELPPIVPVPRGGQPPPLSFSQERYWVSRQATAGTAVPNSWFCFHLTGELDTAAFARSFREIVQRHEVMRTTFAEIDGEAVQVIHPEMELPLSLVDLTRVPGPVREGEAESLAGSVAGSVFDIERLPLSRVVLIRLSEREALLLLVQHHIISDGWSHGVLMRELVTLYQDFAAGREASLPPPAIQYADFAIWQRRHLEGQALEHHASYWRSRLQGPPPVVELPSARKPPQARSSSGGLEQRVLSPDLSSRVRELSQREGASLFMTLLAGFEIFLHLHSGQEDILLITTIANRNHRETEDLLGVLMNFLPLRVDLAGDPDARTLLRQVRDVTLEAYEHQDLPFARMLQELPPDRRTLEGLSPIGFVLQNAPTPSDDLPGLGIRTLEVWNGTAKRDLIVILADDGETFIASAMYRSSVYDRETIRRLLAQYESVLEDLVADPGRPLSGFRLR